MYKKIFIIITCFIHTNYTKDPWAYYATCDDLRKNNPHDEYLVASCRSMLDFIEAAQKCIKKKNCDPTRKIQSALRQFKALQESTYPDKAHQEINSACQRIKIYCDRPVDHQLAVHIKSLANTIITWSDISNFDSQTLQIIELIADQAGLAELERLLFEKQDTTAIHMCITSFLEGMSIYIGTKSIRPKAQTATQTEESILSILNGDRNIIAFLIGGALAYNIYQKLSKKRISQFVYTEEELREVAQSIADDLFFKEEAPIHNE